MRFGSLVHFGLVQSLAPPHIKFWLRAWKGIDYPTLKQEYFVVIFTLFKPKWNIKYHLKWISTLIMQ